MTTTSPEATQERLPLAGVAELGSEHSVPGEAGAWRLDEHTREVGRRGLADARAALAEASRRAAARREAEDAGQGHRHAA